MHLFVLKNVSLILAGSVVSQVCWCWKRCARVKFRFFKQIVNSHFHTSWSDCRGKYTLYMLFFWAAILVIFTKFSNFIQFLISHPTQKIQPVPMALFFVRVTCDALWRVKLDQSMSTTTPEFYPKFGELPSDGFSRLENETYLILIYSGRTLDYAL